MDTVAGCVPEMTSVQLTYIRESIRLAPIDKHADIASLQMGVVYDYPATQDDLLRAVEQIGRACGLQLTLYSNWWKGGLIIDGALLRWIVDLSHVEVVKWSVPLHDAFTEALFAIADLLVVFEHEAAHFWGHLLVASDFVVRVGNFLPRHVLGIWRALERSGYAPFCDEPVRYKSAWGARAWRAAALDRAGRERPLWCRACPKFAAERLAWAVGRAKGRYQRPSWATPSGSC